MESAIVLRSPIPDIPMTHAQLDVRTLTVEKTTIMNTQTTRSGSRLSQDSNPRSTAHRRGRNPVTALIALLLLFSPHLCPAADALTELFQKGLVEEEANRNLDAAIKVYEEVVKQIDTQRKLAATAIFRLGETYRKLGRTNDAVLQYRRIVAEFPEEETLGRLSRQNLAGIGSREAGTALPQLSSAAQEKILGLLREEIKLEEQEVATVERMIKDRLVGPSALIGVRRRVLQLQRELVVAQGMSVATAATEDTDASDPESTEIRRLKALLKNSPDLLNATAGDLTPLQKAASAGQLRVVEFLLENGALRDSTGSRQSAPIHYAAARGHKSVVELLLKAGTPASLEGVSGVTPLHLAAAAGHRQVVQTLIDAGADLNATLREELSKEIFGLQIPRGVTPLWVAIFKGSSADVDALLAAKADVNAASEGSPTPFEAAVWRDDPNLVLWMLDAGANLEPKRGRTAPLLLAVSASQERVVRLLLEKRADPNTPDAETALSRAIGVGQPAILELLLASGALPNAVSSTGKLPSPLQTAILLLRDRLANLNSPTPTQELERRQQCIEILLRAKADVVAPYPDGTPLIGAALDLGAKILRQLLAAGMPANVRLPDGQTPLSRAVLNRNAELLTVLLESKADPNLRDAIGWTALEMALVEQKQEGQRVASGLPTAVMVSGGPSGSIFSGSSGAPTERADLKELISILIAHGAKRDLTDFTQIRMTRDSIASAEMVFTRGTNDWNQFQLYDLLAVIYLSVATPVAPIKSSDQRALQLMALGSSSDYGLRGSRGRFPDFGRMRVHRSRNNDGTWEVVPLSRRANDPHLLPQDTPLEWGDVVEIPELAHAVNGVWNGLHAEVIRELAKVENRRVRVNSGGMVTELSLQVDDQHTWRYFNLSDILYRNGVILSSSDLTRIRVTRGDGKTVYEVNLENPTSDLDLWMKDGDVVEIPNKK